MPKRKQPSKPKAVRDAEAAEWAKPEMQALDGLLRETLKVSKTDLDAKIKAERAERAKTKKK